MRLERIVMAVAGLAVVAGVILWAYGGGTHARTLGKWFLLGAFAVMCLPLFLLLLGRLVGKRR